MGEVWIALDPTLGVQRLVVLKTIVPDLACDPHFRKMFTDEARIASRISHPNVATVLDFGEAEGAPFYVMEWEEALPLRSLQKHCATANETIPPGVAVRI